MKNKNYEYEAIFIGRGGQGVVTAAQLLGEILFLEGFKNSVVIPTFGPERRGAPVETAIRFSYNTIYKLSQPDKADYLFFLDESLFSHDLIANRIKENACIIINSKENSVSLNDVSVYKFPITKTSLANKLIVQGFPVVNTPMLGAIAKITRLITLDNINKILNNKFNEKAANKNMETVQTVYDNIKIKE